MGVTRFSQYNAPKESSCSAKQATAYVFTGAGDCTYNYGVTLSAQFMSQTVINATGRSTQFGLIKPFNNTGLIRFCNYPDGGNQGNTFVQVSKIAGSCNTEFKDGTSLAVNPNPHTDTTGTWNCGDQVALVSTNNTLDSVRIVQDACGRCKRVSDFNGANGHIDVYTTEDACRPTAIFDYNSPATYYGIRLR
jgi:hypothetical protein